MCMCVCVSEIAQWHATFKGKRIPAWATTAGKTTHDLVGCKTSARASCLSSFGLQACKYWVYSMSWVTPEWSVIWALFHKPSPRVNLKGTVCSLALGCKHLKMLQVFANLPRSVWNLRVPVDPGTDLLTVTSILFGSCWFAGGFVCCVLFLYSISVSSHRTFSFS